MSLPYLPLPFRHGSHLECPGKPPPALQRDFSLRTRRCGSSIPFHDSHDAHIGQSRRKPSRYPFRPSRQEHIPFAQYMLEAAQMEYQRTHGKKVPRWILSFALHSLSLEPPPSVVADCLTIVAVDLGYDVSKVATLDARWVQLFYRCSRS